MFARIKKFIGRAKPETSPPAIQETKPSQFPANFHSSSSAAPAPLFYWMRHGPSNANVIYNACKKRTQKNNTRPITKKECNAAIKQITNLSSTRKAINNNLAQMSPVGKMLTKIKTSRIFAHTKIFNPDLSADGIKAVKALLEKVKASSNNIKSSGTVISNNKPAGAIAKFDIKLDNTIIFCSTLIRAIETGLLAFDRNTVDYRFCNFVDEVKLSELTDEQIRNSVFVIPYIKESGVIDTLDNLTSTLDNTNTVLTDFYKNTKELNTKPELKIAGDSDWFNELRNKVSRSRFYGLANKYFPGLQQRGYKIIVISHEHTIKKFTGISKKEPMPNLSIIPNPPKRITHNA